MRLWCHSYLQFYQTDIPLSIQIAPRIGKNVRKSRLCAIQFNGICLNRPAHEKGLDLFRRRRGAALDHLRPAAAAPGKLYLGCRFKSLRNSDALWNAAAKWCDVISVNSYVNSVAVFGEGNYAAPKFDRPILHSEFHFGTMHRGMFSAGLCPVGDQCARGRGFRHVVEGALRHPLFVGSHWFQYRDQPLVGRGDGENYQVGFVDVCDRPYLQLSEAARIVGEGMYETRHGGN